MSFGRVFVLHWIVGVITDCVALLYAPNNNKYQKQHNVKTIFNFLITQNYRNEVAQFMLLRKLFLEGSFSD